MNAYCARDRRPGLRVLIMDDAVKPAHFGSGYGRARHLHLALARLGHMVTLFPWFDGERYESNGELADAGIEVVHHSVSWEDQVGGGGLRGMPKRAAGLGVAWHIGAHLYSALLPGLQGGREVIFRAWADDDRPRGYDLIVISRPHTWKACHGLARTMFPHAPIFYDSEAIIAGRELGMALYRKVRRTGSRAGPVLVAAYPNSCPAQAKPDSLLFQQAAVAEQAEVEILMQVRQGQWPSRPRWRSSCR